MISVFKIYWSKLSVKSKTAHILGVLVLFLLLYFVSGKAWYKYKYYRGLEKEVVKLREEKQISEAKIDSLIGVSDKKTEEIKIKSKTTDKKRIRDEKIIDSKSYSDDELDGFLSDYE